MARRVPNDELPGRMLPGLGFLCRTGIPARPNTPVIVSDKNVQPTRVLMSSLRYEDQTRDLMNLAEIPSQSLAFVR